MEIRGRQPPASPDGFAGATIESFGIRQRRQVGLAARMVEGMAAQCAFGQRDLLGTQCRQPFAHHGSAGEQAGHRMRLTVEVDELLEQEHHAAAFGQQRFAGFDMLCQLGDQVALCRQTLAMQFRITAGQPERIAGRPASGEKKTISAPRSDSSARLAG